MTKTVDNCRNQTRNLQARRACLLVTIMAGFLLSTSAFAQPSFSMSFDGVSSIALNNVATVIYTITNADPAAVTDVAFTNNLPASLSIANPRNAGHDCGGGTLSAPAGGGTITFIGGDVMAASACTISVDLVGTVETLPATNSTGDLTSSAGNSGPAMADLFIDSAAPRFSKSFSPAIIAEGGVSTLTFLMESVGPDTFLNNSFTDDLPPGVVIANPTNATTDCAMGAVVALAAGTNISFSDTALTGLTSCMASLDVTAASSGDYVNTSGNYLFDTIETAGKATALLQVVPPPVFSKSFAPAMVNEGDVSTLTFTIDNTGSLLAAASLSLVDFFPAGLLVAPIPNASSTCTGGAITALAGAGMIQYIGGTATAGGVCTFQVEVTSAMAGVYDNASDDLTSTLGNSGPALATLTVAAPPPPPPTPTQDIPTLPGVGLGLLILMLMGMGVRRIRSGA